ncbi:MAG: FAD-dependent oxidoreductase, partial [Alphaproteobacteria bacterium]
MKSYDVAIIGGGPGGYIAALRASQLGLKTVIIEKEHLGGTCLNFGCIPTKALLRCAEIKHFATNAKDFGIEIKDINVNLDQMVKRSRKVVDQLSRGIDTLLQKKKIDVLYGAAKITDDKKLSIVNEKISAKHVIIATGALPRKIPNIPYNNPRIWTSKEAMTPTFLPKSLLVVGSGAIGMEFANFYNTLGT